jgi:hypothetical protein
MSPSPESPSPEPRPRRGRLRAALLALLVLPLLLGGALTAPAAMACAAEPLPCHPLPPENETVTNRLTVTKIDWGQDITSPQSAQSAQHLYVQIDGQTVWGPTWTTVGTPGSASVNVSKTKPGTPGQTLARIQVRDADDSNDPVGPQVLVATTTSTSGVTKTANISKWWRPIYITYTVRQIG